MFDSRSQLNNKPNKPMRKIKIVNELVEQALIAHPKSNRDFVKRFLAFVDLTSPDVLHEVECMIAACDGYRATNADLQAAQTALRWHKRTQVKTIHIPVGCQWLLRNFASEQLVRLKDEHDRIERVKPTTPKSDEMRAKSLDNLARQIEFFTNLIEQLQ